MFKTLTLKNKSQDFKGKILTRQQYESQSGIVVKSIYWSHEDPDVKSSSSKLCSLGKLLNISVLQFAHRIKWVTG